MLRAGAATRLFDLPSRKSGRRLRLVRGMGAALSFTLLCLRRSARVGWACCMIHFP